MKTERTEILIIGAGPAGSVAAAMLRQQGRKVAVVLSGANIDRERYAQVLAGNVERFE
mgnify:CR=1 FL=1